MRAIDWLGKVNSIDTGFSEDSDPSGGLTKTQFYDLSFICEGKLACRLCCHLYKTDFEMPLVPQNCSAVIPERFQSSHNANFSCEQ